MAILGEASGGFTEKPPTQQEDTWAQAAGLERADPEPPSGESPAALEKERLERAEARMRRFCIDLNELVGRDILDMESGDDLTRDIYEAAIEADVDVEEVMSSGSEWLERMPMALARLARRIPNAEPTRRVRQLVEGKVKDLEDPDAQLALERAREYFRGAPRPVPGYTTGLAVCLLEYGFRKLDPQAFAREKTRACMMDRAQQEITENIMALDEILNVSDEVHERETAHLEQWRQQLRLGWSIKIAATVICGVGLLATGKIIWVPLLLAAYVMGHCFIDRRAIRERERLALKSDGEP